MHGTCGFFAKLINVALHETLSLIKGKKMAGRKDAGEEEDEIFLGVLKGNQFLAAGRILCFHIKRL
jgi:hypothetical protein